MAKLYFYYGTMASSKTANLLITCYNYEKLNKKVILCQPAINNRDGENIIKSRIGLQRNCISLEEFILNKDHLDYDVVIVDEAQFASSKQIDELSNEVDFNNKDVICYGLKTDFKCKFFDGSKRLFEIADCIREIKTLCWCGKKAIFNARIVNNVLVKDGHQIELGLDDKYVPLCRKHYKEGKLCLK